MGSLARSLKEMGFEPTGEESPFEDDGMLWTDGTEKVCDSTGTVVDGESKNRALRSRSDPRAERHKYQNSGKVKMFGGYVSAYKKNGKISY